MKVVLCEKPSQARDIAKGLVQMGAPKTAYENKKDHIVVGDYHLYWAQGHLLEVDLQKTKERAGGFPYFPSKWYYKPIDKHAVRLLRSMKSDLQKAREIIIATDFGREGELIARLILQHLNSNPRASYKRLWTSSSLTPSVVKKAFSQLKPLKEFDNLYAEAKARQKADWLIGINLSIQLMRMTGGRWSIGRVQTPTLALIVKRELEIENFKPQDYSVIEATFKCKGFDFVGKLLRAKVEGLEEDAEDESLKEQEQAYNELRKYGFSHNQAREILEDISKNAKKCQVVDVKKKTKTIRPHKLHTLTSLQSAVNKRWKIGLKDIASAAQWLYDHHFISYPRTESHYMGTDNVDLVKESLKNLGKADLLPKVKATDKSIFNDAKLTDHHALIPLKPLTKAPSQVVERVYNEIANTFLAQFYPKCIEEVLEISTVVEAEKKYEFYTSSSRTVQLGWKELFGQKEKVSGVAASGKAEPITKGDVAVLQKVEEKKRQTNPPSRYTQGTLVNILSKAHLLIPKEQKELRKIMKEKDVPGLGTAATRTPIIEGLETRGYTEKIKGGFIKPTEKGKSLIMKLYQKSDIADPVLTAQLEMKLRDINQGKFSDDHFIKEIQEFVLSEINKFETTLKMHELSDSSSIECPQCSGNVKLAKPGAFCEKCGPILWRKQYGKKLSDSQMKSLLHGKKVLVQGLISKKKNTTYAAYLEYQASEKRTLLNFDGVPPRKNKKKTRSRQVKSSK